MRLTQCICNNCSCASDCEYYEATIKPVINAVTETVLYDDLFTSRIKVALELFECKCFEQ